MRQFFSVNSRSKIIHGRRILRSFLRKKRGKPFPDSFKTIIRGVLKDTEKEERNIELFEIDLSSPRTCCDKIRSLEQPIKKLIVQTQDNKPLFI